MVVAPSNAAVDSIAEKLIGFPEIVVTRVLSADGGSAYGKDHKIGDICLHHKARKLLPEAERDLYDMSCRGGKLSYAQNVRLAKLMNESAADIIKNSHVILCTCIASGCPMLKETLGKVIVMIDDCSQISEASTWILMGYDTDKVILTGDETKLGPPSDVEFLRRSLFHKVMEAGNYARETFALNEQYGVNGMVLSYLNRAFNKNRMVQRVVDGVDFGVPELIFVDCPCVKNLQASEMDSFVDHTQAKVVSLFVSALIVVKKLDPKDILVITPFASQRHEILSQISKAKVWKDSNPPTSSVSLADTDIFPTPPVCDRSWLNIGGVDVSTIGAYQNRLRQVVIFSTESNDVFNDQPVEDKRLNVALTRARSSLFVVGD